MSHPLDIRGEEVIKLLLLLLFLDLMCMYKVHCKSRYFRPEQPFRNLVKRFYVELRKGMYDFYKEYLSCTAGFCRRAPRLEPFC